MTITAYFLHFEIWFLKQKPHPGPLLSNNLDLNRLKPLLFPTPISSAVVSLSILYKCNAKHATHTMYIHEGDTTSQELTI